jgi:SAM-dependent methyltransferase
MQSMPEIIPIHSPNSPQPPQAPLPSGAPDETTLIQTPPLARWFESPLGQYIGQCERVFIDEIVNDSFGYYALQLGLPQIDFLASSRIVNRYVATPEQANEQFLLDERSFIRAELDALPLTEQSIDFAIAPHALEFATNPHGLLREIHRVLRPEGRLLLVGFNPWSMWGVRRGVAKGDAMPWSGRYVSLTQIKDWLNLLGFDIAAGHLTAYAPPIQSEKWRKRFNWLESLGDRWWPVAGGVYMLEAVKRVQAMRVVQPQWSDRRKAKLQVAQVARRDLPGGLQTALPNALPTALQTPAPTAVLRLVK